MFDLITLYLRLGCVHGCAAALTFSPRKTLPTGAASKSQPAAVGLPCGGTTRVPKHLSPSMKIPPHFPPNRVTWQGFIKTKPLHLRKGHEIFFFGYWYHRIRCLPHSYQDAWVSCEQMKYNCTPTPPPCDTRCLSLPVCRRITRVTVPHPETIRPRFRSCI